VCVDTPWSHVDINGLGGRLRGRWRGFGNSDVVVDVVFIIRGGHVARYFATNFSMVAYVDHFQLYFKIVLEGLYFGKLRTMAAAKEVSLEYLRGCPAWCPTCEFWATKVGFISLVMASYSIAITVDARQFW
jgi:hypothetical protein